MPGVSGVLGLLGRLRSNVVLRVVLYYAVLIGTVRALWSHASRTDPVTRQAMEALFGGIPGAGGKSMLKEMLKEGIAAPPLDQTALAVTVVLAMLGAVLLTLPVAWIYILTRAKRGYRQSVVHTLIVLPLVVSGVVVLVKYSLALAFSLAGIVAAVRFRNTLDDSKDAVYVFLATGIGLAAAVDLPVAIIISIVFNLVVLVLWYSDFGRTPAHLEGKLAHRKMQRALEAMSRTGTFVAKIDQELFEEMTAEQLEAVADRAWRRRRRNDPESPDEEGKREALLRVRTHDVGESRAVIEPMFEDLLKKWRFGGVLHESDGTHVVEYTVQLRKNTSAGTVLEELRNRAGAHVIGAELA